MDVKIKEAVQRMLRREPGLYVKRINDYIIIRKKMPKMLAKQVKADLKKKKYRKVKTIRDIIIFRIPT